MKIHIHKSLQAYLDEAIYQARLRRNCSIHDPNAVLASILAKAEAAGDAMRYLDKKGRIAWKATPQLRDHLSDIQADAEADAEAETM
jgi:hypothetical protein